MKIDDINRIILRTLASDGRISNVDLAEKSGLSPSACLRRTQELERANIIKGYRAVIDHDALGIGFIAYVTVCLSDHSATAQKAFERAIDAAPEVKECHGIAGNFEYVLRIETCDLKSYRRFHKAVLGELPQVASMSTYVVMGSPKDDRA